MKRSRRATHDLRHTYNSLKKKASHYTKRIADSTTNTTKYLEDLPRRERDAGNACQNSTKLQEQGSDSAIQQGQEPMKVLCELSEEHLFCFVYNSVVALGLICIAGPVLPHAGRGRTLMALFWLGFIALANIRSRARMLFIWRIRCSTIHFSKVYVDAPLGIVTGCSAFVTSMCCYAGLVLQTVTLADTLIGGRAGRFFALIATLVAPMLLVQMKHQWLIRLQGGLAIFNFLVVLTLLFITIHIGGSSVYSPIKLEPPGDAVSSGNLGHNYGIRTLSAMFMLCPFCFGTEAMSLVASDMKRERNVFAEEPTSLHRASLEDPTASAFSLAFITHFAFAYVTGGIYETTNKSPIHVLSSDAASGSLGFWMKVTLLSLCVAAQISLLDQTLRSRYELLIEYSGQRDGRSDTVEARDQLTFPWARRSVLVSILVPAVLLLISCSIPGATPTITHIVFKLASSAALIVWMVQHLTYLRFHRHVKIYPELYRQADLKGVVSYAIQNDNLMRCCDRIAIFLCLSTLAGGHYAAYHANPTVVELLSSILMTIMLLCGYVFIKKKCRFEYDEKEGMFNQDSEIQTRLINKLYYSCSAK